MKKLFIILAIVAMVFVSCKKETSTNSPIPVSISKKALLVILDGWGIGDQGEDDDGTPNTAHSTNPVPFIYVTANSNARVHNGVLADIAPSILHIMGLSQPQEMTGQCLINE